MKASKALSFSAAVTGVALVAALGGCASPQKDADDQAQIETRVDESLNEFYGEASNAREVVENAAGVLVCPRVTKAGLGVGVERGTCAMQIGGETVEYWRTSSLKGGLLAGVESHSLLMAFNTQEALDEFRSGKREWQVGADFSVAIAKAGATGKFDSKTMGTPVSAFVYGEAGLMYDMSLEGTTFKKLAE
ncbi:MAG: YSC84-related protein [Pseudomonadota bacterium]|nr:YSC84-related protein [Pseudomonadota bacterium]